MLIHLSISFIYCIIVFIIKVRIDKNSNIILHIDKYMMSNENYQLTVLIALIIAVLFSLITRFLRLGTMKKKTEQTKRKMVKTVNGPILFVQIVILLVLVIAVVPNPLKRLVTNEKWFGILVSIVVLLYALMETTTAFMFVDTIGEQYVYSMNSISFGLSVVFISIMLMKQHVVTSKTDTSFVLYPPKQI